MKWRARFDQVSLDYSNMLNNFSLKIGLAETAKKVEELIGEKKRRKSAKY